jgi:hypothetical protein
MKPLFASLALAVLISTLSAPLFAQSSPLDITLRVRPASLKLDDVATVQVVLTNSHANRRVALRGDPGFAAGSGLSLVVIDPTGVQRTVPPTEDATFRDALSGIGSGNPGDNRRAVVLQPGYGLALQRREPARSLFPVPGKYQVRVEYRSPLPAEASGNDLEGAAAVSVAVDVEVTQ